MKSGNSRTPLLIVVVSLLLLLAHFLTGGHQWLIQVSAGLIALGIPLGYYWEIRNNEKKQWLFVLFLLIVSLKIAAFILAHTAYGSLQWVNRLLGFIILALVVVRIVFMTVNIVKHYRLLKKTRPESDFSELIATSMSGAIRSETARNMFSSEIAVFYYLIYKWRSPVISNGFSYYRQNGILSLYGISIVILIVELFATGLLFSRLENKIYERVLLLLSIYSILFIIAHIKAMMFRPVTIDADSIHLRYGLVANVRIDLQNIQSISAFNRSFIKNKESVKLALLSVLEPHNVLVELKEPIDVRLLFKKKTGIKKICFRIDEKDKFLAVLSAPAIAERSNK